ncbi:Uncharacterised protein [Bordetella pertussis]|nr:Uncharacterised protein [Bordetella pertussis]
MKHGVASLMMPRGAARRRRCINCNRSPSFARGGRYANRV